MMTIVVVLGCLVFILLLHHYIEYRIRLLMDDADNAAGRQHHSNDRISSLEVKDYGQDVRLDNHQTFITHLRDDVHNIGSDIGWDDDLSKTQVIPDKPPDDDNTP